MAGVGDLDVATVGQGFADLAAQCRWGDDIVGETDHQHLGGDRPVGRQPILPGNHRHLGPPAGSALERECGEHLEPFPDRISIVDGFRREVLQDADFRGIRRRQLDSGGGQFDIRVAERPTGLIDASTGAHQNGLRHQFRAGQHEFLGDVCAH